MLNSLNYETKILYFASKMYKNGIWSSLLSAMHQKFVSAYSKHTYDKCWKSFKLSIKSIESLFAR